MSVSLPHDVKSLVYFLIFGMAKPVEKKVNTFLFLSFLPDFRLDI